MSYHKKKKSWEFAFGIIKSDNLKPSPEMEALAKKESNGQISKQKIAQILRKKYFVGKKH